MKIKHTHIFLKLFIVCLLGIASLSPLSLFGLQKAHAQFIVHDPLGAVQTTLQAVSLASLETKELAWDALFYDIAQKALGSMTEDILTWINSGFDGNPAFVSDMDGFLLDIADDVATEFIYDSGELSALCEPFQVDVVLALVESHLKNTREGFKEDSICTLEENGGDAEAFLSGDFNAGGWSMWFEAVLNPTNTPIGAYAAADRELAERIRDKQQQKIKDLDRGDGFQSLEVCETVDGKKKCKITTPGSVFRDMTTFALQVPGLSLIQADEMNEVINALFGQLATQAISGANGLLGLGGNDSFSEDIYGTTGNLSYLDALAEERINDSSSDVMGNRIEQALKSETRVLESQLSILAQINPALAAFEDKDEQYAGDSCWDIEFPATAADKLAELMQKMPITISTISSLEAMAADYENSTSQAEQVKILSLFTSLQSEGLISGQAVLIQNESYLNIELRPMLRDFEEEMEDAEASC